MSGEGVRRMMGCNSQLSLALASTSGATAAGALGLVGLHGAEEESMEVSINPAAAISGPLSEPAFGSLAAAAAAAGLSRAPSLTALAPPPAVSPFATAPLPAGAGDCPSAPGSLFPSGPPFSSSPAFSRFLAMLRSGSPEFEAEGRVLRLRRYLRADVPPAVLDAVLDALSAPGCRVEALYVQVGGSGQVVGAGR